MKMFTNNKMREGNDEIKSLPETKLIAEKIRCSPIIKSIIFSGWLISYLSPAFIISRS